MQKNERVSIHKQSKLNLFQSLIKLDFWKVFSLILLCFIYLEWLPSFITIISNFMIVDFRNISIPNLLSIGSFIFTPIIIFILLIPLHYLKNRLLKIYKIMKYILIISLLVLFFMSWICYVVYYQLFSGIVIQIPGLEFFNTILGFHSDYSLLLEQLLIFCQFILFIIVVPLLYLVLTNFKGFIIFDKEFDYGLIGIGIYLTFRYGSVEGIFIRFSILISIIFLLSSIKLYYQRSIKRELSFQHQDLNLESSIDKIPIFASIGILILLGSVFSSIGLYSMGFLKNSYIGLFISLGIFFRKILKTSNFMTKQSKLILDSSIFLFANILNIILIYSHVDPLIISLKSALLCILYFVSSFGILTNSFIFCSKSRHWYHKNPIRVLFFLLILLIGYSIPFISGLYDPISEIISVLILGVSSFCSIIILVILNYKNKNY